jgi:hypothetical protein
MDLMLGDPQGFSGRCVVEKNCLYLQEIEFRLIDFPASILDALPTYLARLLFVKETSCKHRVLFFFLSGFRNESVFGTVNVR